MQACALHNCSKALKLACSSAGPRDFLSLPTFTKAQRLRRWEEHAFLSTPGIDSSYYYIYIYVYTSHILISFLPFISFRSFLPSSIIYFPSKRKKSPRAVIPVSSRKKEKGRRKKVKGNNRRKGRGEEKEKWPLNGGFPRRGFLGRSNRSRIVGHMAKERAACVGVACQAFLRAARKLVTSGTACVSDQSRPDYLTPRRAYVAIPP